MRTLCSSLFVAALLLLAGCGNRGGFSQRTSGQSTANVFRYPIVTNPTTLDPGAVQDGDTIDLIQQSFEGLVTWNENNELAPELAERWDIEDDGRTYVFHIKRGVKFHNGRELTAEDFKWSIERNLTPGFPSETNEQYLSDIVGVREKMAGQAQEVSGVQVVDPYTLKITIDKPRPYFLGKLTYPVSFAMAKEAAPASGPITKIEQMVGTGPFKVTKYEPNLIVELEAFADYHLGKPKLAKILRPIITDAQTRLNKYRQGEIDLVQLERADIKPLQADPKFKDHLHFMDRPSIYYVGFCQPALPVFKDRRVRRAFAMAIDKDEIANDTLGGINQKATGIVPPGVPGHRPNANAIPYDPEGARRLLAEAGFPGGKGFPALKLTFREKRTDIRTVAEKVASQLSRNLNIDVQLQTLEWGSYLNAWNNQKLPFFHMRWAADYLDPENFLSHMLATYGPENKIGYVNQEYDRLCSTADVMLDMEARLPLYAQAEDIALQDAPWIPIYYQRDAELINPRVKGLRTSLFGHLPHYTVSIE